MVAAFDYCLHGRGGAAPSIDTAMHGLVERAHVDHLHPDSGIALATAVDGEALTKECFGDRVVWVPWRRPGFQLGLEIAAVKRGQPAGDRRHPRRPRHHRVGRHERRVRGQLARDHPHRRGLPRRPWHEPSRSGPSSPGFEPLPVDRAARPGGRAGADHPRLGVDRPRPGRATSPTPTSCSTSAPASKLARLAGLGTSCPDHFLRTKVRPLVLDLPPTAPLEEAVARLRELHAAYRDDYRAYYERHAEPDSPADARRRPGDRAGARRRHVLVRRRQADRAGRRRVLRQRHQRDARRRVGLDLRADPRGREVPHRVLGPRGGQAAAPAQAEAARHPCRVRHRRRVGHRPGHRPSPGRRGRVRRRRRRRRRSGRPRSPPRSASTDVAVPVTVDVTDAEQVARRIRRRRCWPSAASTSSSTTPDCRSRSRCSTRPSATGTSSTT